MENYKKLIPIIKRAGKEAAKKWQTYNRSDSVIKSGSQIVTQVDLDTEKYLIKEIKKIFKNHAFLAEESGSSQKKSDYTWIIDPIDGTTNFSIHNPLWSISIGLSYKQEIIFGLIYAPILNEIFYAEKDKGAFLNNKRLKLSPLKNGGKEIHTFCHGDKKRDLIFATKYYKERKLNSLDCRQLGSAAIELAFVAAGRVDSIVIPGAKAWDVAAGTLIAKEAGTLIYDFENKEWTLKSRDLVACRPGTEKTIFQTIKKISN